MLDGVSVSNDHSDVFDPISKQLGLRVNFELDDPLVSSVWRGEVGFVDYFEPEEFIIERHCARAFDVDVKLDVFFPGCRDYHY